MKFSFESQQYRDETAKELKETEKSERREALEKKRRELKFVLMEHIRDFNRKNDTKLKDESIETESKIDKKIITGEIKYDSFLREVNKGYKVEIETTDISDQIPESVRVVYDMNRLLEVEYTYREDEITKGWYKKDVNRNLDVGYFNRDLDDPVDAIVKKYIEMAEKEKGEPLITDDGAIIDSEELKKIAQQAKKDFVKFREEVTGGLVSNPNVFYHTIGAYTEGFKADWYTSSIIRKSESGVKNKLRNRFPHNSDGFKIKETSLEIDEDLTSNYLWVHSGKIIYDNMLKPLMLIDGASPRFKDHFYMYEKQGATYERFNTLEQALKDANTGDHWGIGLKSEYEYTHWLAVADQIFDPYHGRMIKIKEVDTTDTMPDPQS